MASLKATVRLWILYWPPLTSPVHNFPYITHTSFMRLFVGIALANPVIKELSSISLRLKSVGGGIRWTTPDTWHITLQFLGSASPEQYNCVVSQLNELRSSSILIELGKIEIRSRAGIVFARATPTPELLSLQHLIAVSTSVCGFLPQSRAYHPHITLGRIKGKAGAQLKTLLRNAIQQRTGSTGFVAEEYLLYESFPATTGSHYEIRKRFPLIPLCEPIPPADPAA